MSTNLLQINLFCSKPSRFEFTKKMVKQIELIQDKTNIKLCIHGEQFNTELWTEYFRVNKPTFKVELATFNSSYYPLKVEYAHKTDYEYSCKLDDDVLISHHLWDYIISNLDKITDKHPVLAPIFTNGIPSANLFVEDFLSDEDKKIAHKLFLTTGHINPHEWGLNYTSINDYVNRQTEWDDVKYWEMVTDADTEWNIRPVPPLYYLVRGVHPARYSREYNLFIADKIIQQSDKFFAKQNYWLDTYKAPYFCNNLFFCKTDYWRETYVLINDGWDEGQLTLRMNQTNSCAQYVRNGFAIHMAYGMTRGQQEIENYYTANII